MFLYISSVSTWNMNESVSIYLSWALLSYLSFTYPYQKRYIKSLLRPRTDAPTIMGLLRVTVAFPICAPTSVFPSCLAYLKEGLRICLINFFLSCLLFIAMSLTSWYLRTFSIVLPYTELFISIKKSFSKAFLAPCHFFVLKAIYGASQLVWSNDRISVTSSTIIPNFT